jgi:F5/8 type C domain.
MKHYILMALTALTLVVVSCEDSIPPYKRLTDDKQGAMVFIAKAHSGIQNLSIFPYEEERSFRFNVGFGALGIPASDIHISLAEDTHVFDSLNTIRELNGEEPYVSFPMDAYHIDKLNVVVPAGEVSSDFLTVTYYPAEFDDTKDHLLALSIRDASGYAINPSAKTLLIVAPKLEERQASTKGWVASSSSEQLSGENTGLASAVLDGDLNTIWHSQYNPERPDYPHWISIDMINPVYTTKIALAPRQNNPNGFTKFKLEGSTNGTTWFVLADELDFDPANLAYQEYHIEPQSLKNIRLTMLEGRQDVTFLAEFAVFTY